MNKTIARTARATRTTIALGFIILAAAITIARHAHADDAPPALSPDTKLTVKMTVADADAMFRMINRAIMNCGAPCLDDATRSIGVLRPAVKAALDAAKKKE